MDSERIRKLCLAAIALLCAAMATDPLMAGAPKVDSIDMRAGWRFIKGDPEDAQKSDFDDSKWDTVRVPHDWAIAGPFDPNGDGSTGKLPWRGVGWYRKSFDLDVGATDRVYLDFDGVMAFPKVYVNGQLAGEWDYGYTSFRVDATPYINRSGPNVIAVRVDTTRIVSRWYPGAGIYRKVSLNVLKPVHFQHWATFVTTHEISDDSATVNVRTTIENHTDKEASIRVLFEFTDPAGRVVGDTSEPLEIPANGTKDVESALQLPNPQRWDIGSPKLYTLISRIAATSPDSQNAKSTSEEFDREATTFGIRDFKFKADDGFHLNGRRLQLYGVNLHHDLGPLGAAFNVRAMQRQLEIMQDMGVNAIRTSHNAPAPELLDLCDRLGLVVWDECFDKWNETAGRIKGKPSHEEHARRHLRSLVLRDRNHPSVVLWSIGNEIPDDREGVTPARVAMMRDVVREYDDTRPVGLGCHIPQHADTHILDSLDLTGWNYARRYARYRERYPEKPIIYSESASALSTRGFYELPLPATKTDYSATGQVDSYDFNAAPWSDIADAEFDLMRSDPFVAGEFVWTGFDYLGEPTPSEQRKSSYFGIVDLCGIPKDRYYLYRSHWRPDVPTVHILPHWNWPDRVGKPVPVFVFTNGDSAELFLNGKSLGTRTKQNPPDRPSNLAVNRPASASSNRPDHAADAALDDQLDSIWRADRDDAEPRWQVDLGKPQPLRRLILDFEQEAKHYGYVISTSLDGREWKEALVQRSSNEPRWGGPQTAVHDLDATTRFVQIHFNHSPPRATAGIREFRAYSEPAESAYFDPIYNYRLRWNDVVYEPGELKAVAYQNGKPVGEAIVRTASDPASIRLTPDRASLSADGDDLCFVLVEALDDNGAPCPLAANTIEFKIAGPAELAAVGNGDPLALDPFQSTKVPLFYGKAMLIVRPQQSSGGDISITATSPQLKNGQAKIHSAKPAN